MRWLFARHPPPFRPLASHRRTSTLGRVPCDSKEDKGVDSCEQPLIGHHFTQPERHAAW